MRFFLLSLATLLLLSGCSSKKTPQHIVSLEPYTKVQKPETPSYTLHNKTPITLALLGEYEKWRGTPYCYGGDSRDGVDCSAFVQAVYADAFGVKVPRTTKNQAKKGYKIPLQNRDAGDIILFKTGWSSRHSGIYLERGNFMHASKKNGVTISNLNNPYWKNAYWQTRRVLAQ
jgi:probable lipoprotein NlpC